MHMHSNNIPFRNPILSNNITRVFVEWPYLYEPHHRDGVEEVKSSESVQPAGGAGDVSDGERGGVAGKDGVSKRNVCKKAESS